MATEVSVQCIKQRCLPPFEVYLSDPVQNYRYRYSLGRHGRDRQQNPNNITSGTCDSSSGTQTGKGLGLSVEGQVHNIGSVALPVSSPKLAGSSQRGYHNLRYDPNPSSFPMTRRLFAEQEFKAGTMVKTEGSQRDGKTVVPAASPPPHLPA